nr:helix-turn-helix transcriptional regulator [Actinomadura rayongensis]
MAEDFANPKLTLDDIAEAGGVSRRQAELLCARHLGRNPIALLRTIRLFHARNALVIGQRPATRVQHVASGVGYRHQGRFAKHYAHEYGEPPSATLARKPVDSFPGLTDADGPVVITRIAAILGRSSRAATDSASSLKR